MNGVDLQHIFPILQFELRRIWFKILSKRAKKPKYCWPRGPSL